MSVENFNKVVISLGSNRGDKEANVRRAVEWLEGWLKDYRHSHIYATPDAHGGPRQYMNAVVIGTTTLSSEDAEKLCKSYEESCGRDEASRLAGIVPIDIDIVILNDTVIRPRDFSRSHFQIGYMHLK